MLRSKIKILIVMMGLVTSGCVEQKSPDQSFLQPSAVLPVSPVVSISQSDLPPPNNSNLTMVNDNNQVMEDVQLAGMSLAASAIAGVWRASIDGLSCKIATPMTKFGKGYRSAPMQCPNDMSLANSWNVNGSNLEFYDVDGNRVATLASNDGVHFSGKTQSGAIIQLSR